MERVALRDSHPLLFGLIDGIVAAIIGLFLVGLDIVSMASWPLFLLCAFGFQRPASYQVSLILLPLLACTLYSQTPMLGLVLAFAVAIIVANSLVPMEMGNRGGFEHLNYSAITMIVCAVMLMPWFGLLDSATLLMSTGMMTAIFFLMAMLRSLMLHLSPTSVDGFGTIDRRIP